MRLPNGYGSVTKLSGARRRPYMVRVTTDCIYNADIDEYIQKRTVLGYYAKRAEALEALAAYNRNPYSILEANMTVEALWNSIKNDVKASENRKEVYDRVFDKYMVKIHKMAIKDVKTKHLQQIIDECEHGYSTKSNIRTVMKHIFKYAAQNDLVEKNYVDFIEFEQEATLLEREIYTDDEVQKLWEHSDLQEYAITLILLHQGMRIKEFIDLKHEDVDLIKKTIVIQKAKNRYSERTIPIHEKVIDLFRQLSSVDEDHFTTFNRHQYEYFTTKVLGHRAYDSRHTFASKCGKEGIRKVIIQKIMGHKPDSILEEVYTHISLDEMAEAISSVNYGT